MADPPVAPAFYAARPGRARDWWNVLHPPYTAWHLGYVVIGASLAPHVSVSRLVAAVLAFFLAVGVAAHALDELAGRPLRTSISDRVLTVASVVGLVGALVLGVFGVQRVGWALVPFMVVGTVIVAGYNLELLGGRMHTDWMFAAGWGAFPVLTAYTAQTGTIAVAPVLAAIGAFGLSAAQRRLSTPARQLRRHLTEVSGTATFDDGQSVTLDRQRLLAPLDGALRTISWGIVFLAAALAVARLS